MIKKSALKLFKKLKLKLMKKLKFYVSFFYYLGTALSDKT